MIVNFFMLVAVATVGFEVDDSHVLFEGQTTEVCVKLYEPERIDRVLSFEVSYLPNSGEW